MKKLLMFVALLVMVMALVGCSGSNKPVFNLADPISAIKSNMLAFETKDVDSYMKSISSDTPGYGSTKKMIAKLFDAYTFKIELKNLKVVSQKDKEAQVGFTQIMKKVKGPDFKDNQIDGVHTLIKGDTGWQIYNTEIKSVKYL